MLHFFRLIRFKTIGLCMVLMLTCVGSIMAAETSPVGLWKNIDDVSGKPKGLIRITESNGIFSGKIEKLFRSPTEEQQPLCDKCEGSDKNQPIIGMTILKELKKHGEDYTGGTILDPHNGKIYSAKMTLQDNGEKLIVRGYLGISLFGRSQTWIREQ